MNCDKCETPLPVRVRADVRYACGLPSVMLINVEVQRCTNCGNEIVHIPNITGLNKAIAEAVASQEDRLCGAEIRFLRKYLGWSGADAARILGSRAETLSRWENDRLPIPTPTERLLRVLAMSNRPVEFYEDMLGELGRERRHEGLKATLRDSVWMARRSHGADAAAA